MAKLLTADQIARFREAGYLSGIRVLSEEEAGCARQAALAFLETHGRHPDFPDWTYYKTHLLFGWVDALVHQPRLLDAVEDLLGPDVLLWNSFLPFKGPGRPLTSAGTRTRPIGAWSRPPSGSRPGWRSVR